MVNYVFWIVRDRALAEDIVQEALLRLWRAKGVPENAEGFRNWLYRTAGNLAIDALRRRRVETTLRFWVEPPPDPFAEVESRLGDPALARALGHLSARERRCLYLVHVADLSHAEAAAAMQVSEGNARVILHRALGKLRRQLHTETCVEPS